MTRIKNIVATRTRRLGVFGGVAALALTAGTAAVAAPANAAQATTGTWDKLAQCESGGNWNINTGNGFKGGLQFTSSTWKAFGGSGSANNASKSEQIRVAKNVLKGQGWGAWPACSKKLGLSGKGALSEGGSASTGKHVAKKTTKKYTTSTATVKKATTKYVAPKAERTVAAKRAAKSYVAPKVYVAPKTTKQVTAARSYVAPKVSRTVTAQRAAAALPSSVKDSGKNYTVKAGDTLFEIAQATGVGSWKEIYALNKGKISNPNLIFVGQSLDLPA